MSGAVMNYDFGPKRHWRRWVWNRIAERVDNPSSSTVCYLPGQYDFDREIAQKKGFSANNLIAFERDGETTTALRQRRVLTVSADVIDAIHSLSERKRVDVVYLDFCSGLHTDLLLDVGRWCWSPHLVRTVFALNLLRGRDAESNELRQLFRDDCPSFAATWSGILGHKHRALSFASGLALNIAVTTMWSESGTPPDDSDATVDVILKMAGNIFRDMAPSFNSYRSAACQTFDSLVFRNPLAACDACTQAAIDAQMAHYKSQKSKTHLNARRPKVADAGRAVAAVLAHRTRRLNALG